MSKNGAIKTIFLVLWALSSFLPYYLQKGNFPTDVILGVARIGQISMFVLIWLVFIKDSNKK